MVVTIGKTGARRRRRHGAVGLDRVGSPGRSGCRVIEQDVGDRNQISFRMGGRGRGRFKHQTWLTAGGVIRFSMLHKQGNHVFLIRHSR